jgi:hypothetical protein
VSNPSLPPGAAELPKVWTEEHLQYLRDQHQKELLEKRSEIDTLSRKIAWMDNQLRRHRLIDELNKAIPDRQDIIAEVRSALGAA